jgi:predicted metal-dependent hydrolase
MQRYFVHLENRAFTSKDASPLLLRARSLVEKMGVIIRDSRVSKKYIEFDTSIPESANVTDMVGKLVAISPLSSYEHIVDKHMDKDEAIKHAIALFNDEKYWSTHEALEMVWKSMPEGKERNLVNGIILVSAAFVHDEKNETEICLSILQRAMKKLDGVSGSYHGIDMDRFVSLVSKIIATGKIERFTI